jgi:hypothetical protein
MFGAEQLVEVWTAAGACSRAALRRALENAQPVLGRKGRQTVPLPGAEMERLFRVVE